MLGSDLVMSNVVGVAPAVWLNGRLVYSAEAVVPVSDRGLLTGEGVFETLLVRRGEPFAFRRHYRRLLASASHFRIEVPVEHELRAAAAAVVRARGCDDARLRITLTAGNGVTPTVLVTADDLPVWSPAADVVTFPFPRNDRSALAGVKSTSYAENMLARTFAARRGASEAVFGNTRRNLCEGAASNLFAVWEGKLVTPPLSSGCLAGVTRELVFELCRSHGIAATEADSPLARLADSEEAFLTSTTRGVQPVARVDARLLGQVNGPVTQRVAALYRDLLARDADP
jgi:branched-chain amino acid aminotransferase